MSGRQSAGSPVMASIEQAPGSMVVGKGTKPPGQAPVALLQLPDAHWLSAVQTLRAPWKALSKAMVAQPSAANPSASDTTWPRQYTRPCCKIATGTGPGPAPLGSAIQKRMGIASALAGGTTVK